jgi:hypothetical protein
MAPYASSTSVKAQLGALDSEQIDTKDMSTKT